MGKSKSGHAEPFYGADTRKILRSLSDSSVNFVPSAARCIKTVAICLRSLLASCPAK
ncbi:MAG: hypothetical protein AAFX01_10200 [Cyanobacteria bacterium J06638_28]